MKKTIPMIIKMLLINGMIWTVNLVHAQLGMYPEIYPPLPFDLAKVTEFGNNKCTVWKGIYKMDTGDESGSIWSIPIEASHQYQRYVFPDGKMTMISTYVPIGDKQWTMEFFYKQDLLSAIEKLVYDSLQNSKLDFTYAYFYQHNGIPFQRVKMYGHPNKSVRLLDEFEFDSLTRVIRQKTTAVGNSPQMDSLVGLKDKEKRLAITEYTPNAESYQVYQNLYALINDKKTFLDEEGNAVITKVRNSSGKILFTIDYKYEGGRLAKKLHWVMRETERAEPPEEKEFSTKKKKKKKKTKVQEVKVNLPVSPPKPEIYKLEYFAYTEEGLLETHIIEEDGIQTVFEYTYFEE
ncbi:hypothetical protein [Aureispira anguillae]|uniref:Uncharacterized protein n=1 Tax=Aureispira anguillae TaxID=2864201 RepID=A0A915YHX0_9BACT|nr:hypothetical protein [Aureispira anguillae]BDS13498.1 hypothetical protein AsAng_0042360 [Aureispira anguillae]